jgi:CubicO group peptidase (beta-lactamase class C family)
LRSRIAALQVAVLFAAAGCSRTSDRLARWERAAPKAVGFDALALDSLTADIRAQKYPNVHALLIEKDGHLVLEQYFAGEDERRGGVAPGYVVFNSESVHDIRSISKSVTAALVGIALGDGSIKSLDQSILDFYPEHADLATPEKRTITIRHALTMSIGLQWSEAASYADTANDERRLNRSADPFGLILSRSMAARPGSTFNYSAAATHLLLGAVQRGARKPALEYAREVLFAPLGITDLEWVHDTPALPSAASGLRMRPADLAKFGSLYLNGGRWQGRQIIPESWIEESRKRQIELPPADSDSGRHGYAFQWWHSRFPSSSGDLEVLVAAGNGGQSIFVVPQHRMVVTILGGRYHKPDWINEDILLDRIIPALKQTGRLSP